jgi:predicted transcriptional regulator
MSDPTHNRLADEKHYSPAEIAELWGLSPTKVRRMFLDEPGVMKIGEPSQRIGRRLKRRYFSLRIPASVRDRVHTRLISRSR